MSAESFDFGDKIFGGVLIAEAEGDVGASGGESDGDGAAESAGGARDKGCLASQGEIWDLGVGLSGHGR